MLVVAGDCRSWLSCVVVVAAVVGGAGCATTSIGVPPSDLELVNDGSPELQSALHRKYALYYANNAIHRPGASNADVSHEMHKAVADARVDASDDEVRSYMSSSPDAAALLDSPLVAADRLNNQLGATLSVAVMSATGFVAGVLVAPALFGAGPTASSSTGANVGIGLAIALEIGAPAGYALSALVAKPITHVLAGESYREATEAWNRDLDARISKAATKAPAYLPSAEKKTGVGVGGVGGGVVDPDELNTAAP